MPDTSRPHPLRSKAVIAGIIGALGVTASALGVEAEVITEWAGVAGAWVSVLVTAGVIVVTGEPVVTPVSDPVLEVNGRTVPLVPDNNMIDAEDVLGR